MPVKVGKLTYRDLGCCYFVTGPNFLGMLFCWFMIYFFFGGIMIVNAFMQDWKPAVEVIIWTMISVSTLTFIKLCTSDPGIPPQIMEACKIMSTG